MLRGRCRATTCRHADFTPNVYHEREDDTFAIISATLSEVTAGATARRWFRDSAARLTLPRRLGTACRRRVATSAMF